jgi:SRSO17 transposase
VQYYLSNLPADTSVERLVGPIKAHYVCEQAHQQMQEDLGLDHFEARSWHGLRHHALMVMIAMAFLKHLRLAEHHRTRPKKKCGAAFRGRHHRRACPPCRPSSSL